MSLRTVFLEELNALAEKEEGDVSALISKMRQVMVGRHPATLSSEEQDPVATVALAWKGVAARGRVAFEEAALTVIRKMDSALLPDAAACDWPLTHAVLRLLLMLPHDKVDAAKRKTIVKLLAGTLLERSEVLTLLEGDAAKTDGVAFWTDAFRLYLNWHEQKPGVLQAIWQQALTDEHWPLEDGAIVFLEDAARRHPEFVTINTLVAFWRAALSRSADIKDLKRWFYVIGCALEDSAEGLAVLADVYKRFEHHLKAQQFSVNMLPRDHFIEVVSRLFRNSDYQEHIRSFKTSPRAPMAAVEHYRSILPAFKGEVSSVGEELERRILNPHPVAMTAG